MSETNDNAAFENWREGNPFNVNIIGAVAYARNAWDAARAISPVDAAAVAKGIAGMPHQLRAELAECIRIPSAEDRLADLLRPILPTPGAGTGGEWAAQKSMSGGYYIGELAGVGVTAQVNNGTDANVMGALFKGLLADSATLARARELAGEADKHECGTLENLMGMAQVVMFLLSPAPKGEVQS